MLIYVDKKEQKRKKIKICFAIFFSIFFVVTNVFHFKHTLHTNEQSLTSYQSIKSTNQWYSKTDCFYIFVNPKTSSQKVIIIPPFFNKKIALMIAATLNKYEQENSNIILTPELISNKKLQTLVKKLSSNTITDIPNQTIITTDYELVKDLITKENLYPIILNYTEAQKENAHSQIIDDLFPEKPLPQNQIEEEKLALENFVKDNIEALKQFINEKPLSFNLENIFLQNIRFCVETTSQTICQTDNDTSFEKKLNQVMTEIGKDTIKRLVLFTSDEKISILSSKNIQLEEDEGLHFKYYNFESFLLSDEIKEQTDNKILYTLKEKAGINPEYKNPQMKFFKFKTVEVTLDENI